MRCLREVNVDNNTVGWYTSTYLGSFLHEGMIDTQYNYQATIKKCVVIVFDPLKTAQGLLSLKAFRLSQSFMDLYSKQSFTKESLDQASLSYRDVFEQIPIRIHNGHLINALLYDLDGDSISANFERLNLSTNPFLEKTLEFSIDCLDDLSVEQNKFQYYQKSLQRQQTQMQAYLQKKKAEGTADDEEDLTAIFKPIPQPSRLESLLITNQISNYCEQINTFAGTSFTKLFLYGGMQK